MNIFAVCAFAVATVAIVAVLKPHRPEVASIAVAVAGVLIFINIAEGIAPFVSFVRNTASSVGADGYFSVMLKALSISLCCRMSAEVCRDCGESTLAYRVELAGKVGIVLLSLPIVQKLFEFAKDLLG